MKRTILIVTFLGAIFWITTTPAFAQHGRPAGAADAPRGAAASRSGGSSATDAGKKTPDQLLSKNTRLSDNLTKLLPSGTTPQQACQNFKNLGQCVAAIHVAHNLGINFNSLACDMTLKPVVPATSCPAGTGSKGMSLGKSIDALKPGTDSKSESKRATEQANADIKQTNS